SLSPSPLLHGTAHQYVRAECADFGVSNCPGFAQRHVAAGVGERVGPSVAEDERRDEHGGVIDEARGEQCAVDARTTFDEHARDAALRERQQRTPEIEPTLTARNRTQLDAGFHELRSSSATGVRCVKDQRRDFSRAAYEPRVKWSAQAGVE